jgi:hypothetical protein
MSKQTKKEDFPALECPHCEKPVAPYSLNVDGSVTYSLTALTNFYPVGQALVRR